MRELLKLSLSCGKSRVTAPPFLSTLGLFIFLYSVIAANYRQNAVFLQTSDVLSYLQSEATTADRKQLSVKAFQYFSKVPTF